jgi:hypothetical protein
VARAAVERAERAPEERVDRDRLAVLPPLRLLLLALRLLLPLLRLLLPLLRLLLPLLRLLLLRREPLDRPPLEREDWLRPDELPELEPLLLAWGMASSWWDGPRRAVARGRTPTSYPFARVMRARRRAYRSASGVR